MSSHLIRPATPEDAAPAVAVIRASITELCVETHQNDEATLARWLSNKTPDIFQQWLANPEIFLVVAQDTAGLSGIGSIKRSGELNLCYVRPGRQGHGVGRALLLALEDRAQRWGLDEIRLVSSVEACPFYERHGYVSAGAPRHHYGRLLSYPYVKSLPEPTAVNGLQIVDAASLPADFEDLLGRSLHEGFRALKRMRDEWHSGANRFSASGEAVYQARLGARLVGICGLNRDPYSPRADVGRVRHLYVDSRFRRRGIGRLLISNVLAHASATFTSVRLRTSSADADRFYASIGFERISHEEHATHQLALSVASA